MLGASISYPHPGHLGGAFASTSSSASTTAAELYDGTANSRQSRTESRSNRIESSTMATCYSAAYELTPPSQRTVQVPVQKDYTRPLHVDCSVEYELPNTAKPPQGVRNEPLLMIHPCYFRKIESQRRSPFINNLPTTTRQISTAAVATTASGSSSSTAAAKRRIARSHHQQQQQQQIPAPQQHQQQQQVPSSQQQAAQYPVQYSASTDRQQQQLWEPMPPLVPISQVYNCKRDQLVSTCGTLYSSSGSDSGHWTDPDRSPDRPEDKHILSGKYRQYLRAHRLHPYVTSAIPLASTFPQIQQVCYNV